MKSMRLYSVILMIAGTVLLSFQSEAKGIKDLLKGVGRGVLETGKDMGTEVLNGILNGSDTDKGTSQSTERSTRSTDRSNRSNNRSTANSRGAAPTSYRGTVAPDNSETTDGSKITSLVFNNLTTYHPMFRFTSSDALVLDSDHSMCLQGMVSINAKGHRGKRLVCIVTPLVSGSQYADNIGPCEEISAFTPASDNYTGEVSFALPFEWLGMDGNSTITRPENVSISVTLADFGSAKVLSEATFNLTSKHMQFDKNVSMNLLGSFFSGTPDGNVISTCSACDGTGLCNNCYGHAYLDPSMCPKCANNPGVCRRCKGMGKEGAQIEDDSSFGFPFF